MKAAILAGGAGTRLYPITAYVPKSLIPIGSRYVIEHILEYLKRYNVLDIVMLISEKESDLLRNHLGDGKRLGVNIEYSVAERIGTAGALGAASTLLGDRFLVYYGDVLTDMNLADMIRFHEDRRATCTIAMSTSVPMEYGVARVAEDGRVTYFEEKPIIKEYPGKHGNTHLRKRCSPILQTEYGHLTRSCSRALTRQETGIRLLNKQEALRHWHIQEP